MEKRWYYGKKTMVRTIAKTMELRFTKENKTRQSTKNYDISVLIAWPKDTSTVTATYWSLTCALITLTPLCNCCNFHVNSRNCFMLRKQKLSIQTYRAVTLYTHTVGITGVSDPHSWCTQRLQNNLSYHTLKLFTYNAHIKFSIFLVILPPMKTNKLISFRLYQFNLIILYTNEI